MSKETPQKELQEPSQKESQEAPGNFYVGLAAEAELEHAYTPQEVSKLFFNSFRFSQGEPGIQQLLYNYLCKEYGDRLSSRLIQDGIEIAAPRIEKFVSAGVSHTVREEDRIKDTIDEERQKWLATLDVHNSGKEMVFDTKETLKQILARETRFLVRGSGRPRPNSGDGNQSGPKDKFTSHIVYYGLLENSTGMPEYDKLFKELLAELPNIPSEGRAMNRYGYEDQYSFYTTLEKHFSAHPEDKAKLPQDSFDLLGQVLHDTRLESLGLKPVQ